MIKKALLPFLSISISLGIIYWAVRTLGLVYPHIEQCVMGNTPSKQMGTLVWYNGEIIWSKWDDVGTLSDSLVHLRYQEATQVKHTIETLH